jgi:hypothetical protein
MLELALEPDTGQQEMTDNADGATVDLRSRHPGDDRIVGCNGHGAPFAESGRMCCCDG